MNTICKRCIMDTSDHDIVFDENGFCNHCTKKIATLNKQTPPIEPVVDMIRRAGEGHDFDCLVGLSGGVDSCYVLHLVKKRYGLRPLAFHLDNEWNTQVSEDNIRKMVTKLDVPLIRLKVDWDEFRDLQLSFLKSGTPDLEIPTDHGLIASLYQAAGENDISYIVSGHNYRTEGISVPNWSHGHYDWRYVRLMQKRYGSRRLKSFPHLGIWNLFYHQVWHRRRIIRLLNYLPEYDKQKVVNFLKKEYGWESYVTKHAESSYTFFVQAYVLPMKFGYDKRKMHLSDLICAGQLTRAKALSELQRPLFNDEECEKMLEQVCEKLQITRETLDGFMQIPNRSYFDYPSYETHLLYRVVREMFKKMKPQV